MEIRTLKTGLNVRSSLFLLFMLF